ncbi:MAG: guanylate kinase [Alphaproteobacteria bacterium]|nr:guanylate kinase [Alphaproteobacteria bacterium]
MQSNSYRGVMLVLSSPSGAGKTSIVKELLKQESSIITSISVTTRPARPGEIDGHDYHFINHETYHQMLKAGELLEHAEVYGNFYGTLKTPVSEALSKGKDIIFDLDWQGTQQLSEAARADLVSIFILPPSLEELEKRLRKRAQDSEEVVKRRMASASHDLTHWAEYDYVIINENFEYSVECVRSILKSEKLKRTRQPSLHSFVNCLRNPKG